MTPHNISLVQWIKDDPHSKQIQPCTFSSPWKPMWLSDYTGYICRYYIMHYKDHLTVFTFWQWLLKISSLSYAFRIIGNTHHYNEITKFSSFQTVVVQRHTARTCVWVCVAMVRAMAGVYGYRQAATLIIVRVYHLRIHVLIRSVTKTWRIISSNSVRRTVHVSVIVNMFSHLIFCYNAPRVFPYI
jgi:hypothetical protein